MKNFIVSGDQHLAINKHSPTEWQVSRYEELFDTYVELCKEYNAALILAGDWFHKAEPELEEIQLTMQFFRRCKTKGVEVFIIAGNHCTMAPGRNTLQYLDMGRDKTIDINFFGIDSHHIPEEKVTLHFVSHSHLPCSPKDGLQTPLPLEFIQGHGNALVSHFRATINQFIKEEVDVEAITSPFDIAICGDIHEQIEVVKVWYTGQPVNSMFENKANTGVLLLTIDNGTFATKRIKTDLPALIQRNCTAAEFETLEINDRDFYRVEVTGTLPELRLLAAKPNMKLIKQPLVDEVLFTQEEEQPEVKDANLETGLTGYMQELQYSLDKIGRMLHVWGTV